MTGLLSDDSVAQVSAYAAAGARGSLVIVQAAEVEVAVAAGLLLGESVVGDAQAALIDVQIAQAQSDRWSMAELDDAVITASRYVPMVRTVMVVVAADAMEQAAAEHLLKTVEEPPAGALFVFAVTDVDALPVTIRGRAAQVLRVHPAGREVQVAALCTAGFEPQQAEKLVEVAGAASVVAAALRLDGAGRDDLLERLAVVHTVGLGSTQPTHTAVRVCTALEAVAEVVTGAKPGKSPQARSVLRTLVRRLLQRLRAQLSANIPQATTVERFAWVLTAAAALDDAERDVGAYLPVQQVLAVLLNRCADPLPASSS